MSHEIIEQFSIHRGGTHLTSRWIKELFDQDITILNEVIAKPLHEESYMYSNNLRKLKIENKGHFLLQIQDLDFSNDYRYVYDFYKIEMVPPIFQVLILKDFFSLMYSHIQSQKRGRQFPHKIILNHIYFSGLKVLWKGYAREFVGETENLKNKICISLNHLTDLKSYRKGKANEFKKVNKDKCFKNFQSIPSHDFSIKIGTEINGNLKSYQDRIEFMLNDNVIPIKLLSYIFDEEIISLNKRIFGDVLDIERIVNDRRFRKNG